MGLRGNVIRGGQFGQGGVEALADAKAAKEAALLAASTPVTNLPVDTSGPRIRDLQRKAGAAFNKPVVDSGLPFGLSPLTLGIGAVVALVVVVGIVAAVRS